MAGLGIWLLDGQRLQRVKHSSAGFPVLALQADMHCSIGLDGADTEEEKAALQFSSALLLSSAAMFWLDTAATNGEPLTVVRLPWRAISCRMNAHS